MARWSGSLFSLRLSPREWQTMAAPVPRREGPEVGLGSLDQGWSDSVPRCQPVRVCKGAVVLNTLWRFRASVFLLALRAKPLTRLSLTVFGIVKQRASKCAHLRRLSSRKGSHPASWYTRSFTAYFCIPRDIFRAASSARSRSSQSLSVMVK